MAALSLILTLLFAVHVRSIVIPTPEQFALIEDDNLQDSLTTASGNIEPPDYPQKIAIIGSGITGAIAAFNLREGFRTRAPPDQQPFITVFERNAVVGGRITQAYAYDSPLYPVDTCAATFALGDTCISQTLTRVGLTPNPLGPKELRAGVGIWDGKEFVAPVEDDGFRNPQLWSTFRKVKWYQRYGDTPWSFQQNVTDTRFKFDQLVRARTQSELTNPGMSNLSAAVENAQLQGLVQSFTCSGKDGQRVFPDEEDKKGLRFVEDVIAAGERERWFANFMELNLLQYLLGYEEANPISVQGGNLRLIDRLLRLSTTDIRVNTDVRMIEGTEDYKTQLTSISNRGGLPRVETFDAVILASSLQLANITMDPPLIDHPEAQQNYSDSFVTHFTTPGSLNATYFNRNGTMPQNIFTTDGISALPPEKELPFFSLTLLSEIVPPGESARKEKLFKVVSRKGLSDSEIEQLLTPSSNKDDAKRPLISWIDRQPLPRSVPILDPAPDTCRSILEDIVIPPGIFYAGAGEQVVASAEFGCRMGSNVADLILDGEMENN